MIIERKEEWGKIIYKLPSHKFEFILNDGVDEIPNTSSPIVLNIDLTLKCNMRCRHCVAKDMETLLGENETTDLIVTKQLISNINKSPFLVVVITGGEPLLPICRKNLISLLQGIKGKGIIIDTNGTIDCDLQLLSWLEKRQVMIRVSWDLPHPKGETELRVYPIGMFKNPDHYMHDKENRIKNLIANGVVVSAQTVITGKNINDSGLYQFPAKLKQLGIKQWYLQRFIPSNEFKEDCIYHISVSKYEETVKRLKEISSKYGVDCITKKDKRHNSVFLLVQDGDIYTQSGTKPGVKIKIGKLGKVKDWFARVSGPDHTDRYFLRS